MLAACGLSSCGCGDREEKDELLCWRRASREPLPLAWRFCCGGDDIVGWAVAAPKFGVVEPPPPPREKDAPEGCACRRADEPLLPVGPSGDGCCWFRGRLLAGPAGLVGADPKRSSRFIF